MDIIRDLLKNMSDKSRNSIFLREIALLMEEIDSLKERLKEKEKLVKSYEKQMRSKNDKFKRTDISWDKYAESNGLQPMGSALWKDR